VSFNLRDPDAQTALDIGDVRTFANMAAFIKVLKVGAKLLEEFTWGPGTHTLSNLACEPGLCLYETEHSLNRVAHS
jgi:hypothetical protein